MTRKIYLAVKAASDSRMDGSSVTWGDVGKPVKAEVITATRRLMRNKDADIVLPDLSVSIRMKRGEAYGALAGDAKALRIEADGRTYTVANVKEKSLPKWLVLDLVEAPNG